jgi:hypothetical protein
MHTPEEQSWDRSDLLEEVTVQNVADYRAMRQPSTLTVIIRHPHLSEAISLGPWDLHARLGHVLKTLEEDLPPLLRALEARVPTARRAPLSPVGDGSAVPCTCMVEPCVVCGGQQW